MQSYTRFDLHKKTEPHLKWTPLTTGVSLIEFFFFLSCPFFFRFMLFSLFFQLICVLLVFRLCASSLELTGFIKEVRHNKHGSLTGLSLEDIVASVSELVEQKIKVCS